MSEQMLSCPACNERTIALTLSHPPEDLSNAGSHEPLVVNMDARQTCNCALTDEQIEDVMAGVQVGYTKAHEMAHEDAEGAGQQP